MSHLSVSEQQTVCSCRLPTISKPRENDLPLAPKAYIVDPCCQEEVAKSSQRLYEEPRRIKLN
jgi:hypothetical protein